VRGVANYCQVLRSPHDPLYSAFLDCWNGSGPPIQMMAETRKYYDRIPDRNWMHQWRFEWRERIPREDALSCPLRIHAEHTRRRFGNALAALIMMRKSGIAGLFPIESDHSPSGPTEQRRVGRFIIPFQYRKEEPGGACPN
jgi:hypothetical protein